jgi:hypothetical protein
MNPRLFILTALHDALRRMPLADYRWHEPKWDDGEFVRACKLRFERGEETAWDEFVQRLATQFRFAPSIRDVLIELDVVYRDPEMGELAFSLPDHVSTFAESHRDKLLTLLDSEYPVELGAARRANGTVRDTASKQKGRGEIMYIEMKPDVDGPARIGRVFFSQTRKTLYYRDLVLQSLKGGGGLKANYDDVKTGNEYWVSKCKKRGNDTLYAGSIEIDDDVREEYWTTIRGQPANAHAKAIRSRGKYSRG